MIVASKYEINLNMRFRIPHEIILILNFVNLHSYDLRQDSHSLSMENQCINQRDNFVSNALLFIWKNSRFENWNREASARMYLSL